MRIVVEITIKYENELTFLLNYDIIISIKIERTDK